MRASILCSVVLWSSTVLASAEAPDATPTTNAVPTDAAPAPASPDAPSAPATTAPPRKVYEGGLARSEIQAVVGPRLGDIKACYERALRRNPDLEGTIVAHFIVNGEGHVDGAVVQPPLKADQVPLTDEAVVACVLDVIRSMRFPKPAGGGKVNVTYPFIFTNTALEPDPPPKTTTTTTTTTTGKYDPYYRCNILDIFGRRSTPTSNP